MRSPPIRFSLRTLLAVMVLAAFALGLLQSEALMIPLAIGFLVVVTLTGVVILITPFVLLEGFLFGPSTPHEAADAKPDSADNQPR